MKTVTVNASKTYDVKIGSHLLADIGSEIAALGNVERVYIVSDSTVWALYGEAVKSTIEQSGFSAISFVFPAGEKSKNADVYLSLVNFLADSHLTRTDLIVALGGGVVGDLAGFAAATYLRGIRFVQLPTTLLAAVDSSVGGKTAVDLPSGKNLLGAFWQPSLVLCDIDTLSTLPEDIFRDGCAEVIKYAVLYDPELFRTLEENLLSFDREEVIARCVALKRDVVMLDERDNGARMMLNLGHTIGHGVEASSDFSISHGKAVSIGMAIAARGCASPDCERIVSLLSKFDLPTTTDTSADVLYRYTLSDKKRNGSTIRLILPRAIGQCEITPMPTQQLPSFIKAGL